MPTRRCDCLSSCPRTFVRSALSLLALALVACGNPSNPPAAERPAAEAAATPAAGAPQIVVQPRSATVAAGAVATFSVEASGTSLRYQWQRDGEDLPKATERSYTTASGSPTDTGTRYTVVVSNDQGNVASEPAMLTVVEAMFRN